MERDGEFYDTEVRSEMTVADAMNRVDDVSPDLDTQLFELGGTEGTEILRGGDGLKYRTHRSNLPDRRG